MDRRKLTIGGIVLAIVCFVALNVWGGLDLRRYRLDLTETGQFTLSEGTERLLAGIEEPITLRLYVSSAVRAANPYLGTYADRVDDLLRTYAAQSNGRITVEQVDPEPFSQEEDRAVGFGLQAVSLGEDTSGYLGLAGTNSTDDVDVLPVLSPEREPFLEYDVTRLVYNLANPQKPVAAVIGSLPLNGDPSNQYQPWQVTDQLEQFFELRFLGGDVARIEPEVKLLLLAQPTDLSERTLYAIDNFVLRGGRAVVFVDPHSEAASLRQGQPSPNARTGSDVPRLFTAWGIEMMPDRVVADPATARQVAYPSGGREQVVDYLPWMSLERANMPSGEVITAELQRINVASAGILRARDGATTTIVPLLQSGPEAMQLEADRVRMYPDPFAIIREFQPGDARLTIAARIEGPVKTAFPGGKPADSPDGPEPLAEAQRPINVVVVADTDILDDRNWLASQPSFGQAVSIPLADNANFVANALDYLAGSEALIGLRGREVTFRPFLRVAEIRLAAEQQYRAKEQELLQRLGELQSKVDALRPTADGEDAALVSEQQQREIEGFRGELLATRAELREVQLALRQDIEQLRGRIQFLNIAAVPLAVALVAVLIALFQRARYRRRVDAAAA